MRPTLDGVPETTLWTLHNRAGEALRPDALLDDPIAVDVYRELEHPFHQRFGAPSQAHPLRARCFDQVLRAALDAHGGGTVVALGEGLQTTFWRLDDPRVRWVSVDLPDIVAMRRDLLPDAPTVRTVAGCALDTSWADAVEEDDPARVTVTAEGLLMYFERPEVHDLLGACARRFPGGRMLLDSIPPWLSRRTQRGRRLSADYTPPPMPWGATVTDLPRELGALPGVAAVRELPLPSGRGLWRRPVVRATCALPVLGAQRPACWQVDFAPA